MKLKSSHCCRAPHRQRGCCWQNGSWAKILPTTPTSTPSKGCTGCREQVEWWDQRHAHVPGPFLEHRALQQRTDRGAAVGVVAGSSRPLHRSLSREHTLLKQTRRVLCPPILHLQSDTARLEALPLLLRRHSFREESVNTTISCLDRSPSALQPRTWIRHLDATRRRPCALLRRQHNLNRQRQG